MPKLSKIDINTELKFRTSRSGGSGGQHVNKVSTRVEVLFDVVNSGVLSELQKQRILEKLGNRVNSDGVLAIAADDERSQSRNKKIAIDRLYELLEAALYVPKKRRPTRPSRASKEKRLQAKKVRGEVKKNRRKPPGSV